MFIYFSLQHQRLKYLQSHGTIHHFQFHCFFYDCESFRYCKKKSKKNKKINETISKLSRHNDVFDLVEAQFVAGQFIAGAIHLGLVYLRTISTENLIWK
jgi:hypothetical protein